MKSRIDGLKNRVSRLKSWPINYPDLPPLSPQQVAAYPDVIQPLVRTHPITGPQEPVHRRHLGGHHRRPCRRGKATRSWPSCAISPPSPASSPGTRWRAGDALMWDNRATLHSATDFDQDKHIRHMHRTTIMDDMVPS